MSDRPDNLKDALAEIDRLRRMLDKPLWTIWQQAEEEARADWFGDRASRDEIRQLRDLLARLEWPETLPGTGPWHVCPVCCNHRDEGHEDDCWLGAALGKHEAAATPKDDGGS